MVLSEGDCQKGGSTRIVNLQEAGYMYSAASRRKVSDSRSYQIGAKLHKTARRVRREAIGQTDSDTQGICSRLFDPIDENTHRKKKGQVPDVAT